MQQILSVTRVGGHKYVVARASKYVFLRIDDAQAVESVQNVGETGLYYDDASSRFPLGRDSRILILGLGGGTCARRYRELGGQGSLYGVESNPEILRLGFKFFALGEQDVTVIPIGASRFIEEAISAGLQYDCVFDDLYTAGATRVIVDARALCKRGGCYLRNEGAGKVVVENIK